MDNSAFLENSYAQYALGILHRDGIAKTQDTTKAILYFSRSSANEYEPAIDALNNSMIGITLSGSKLTKSEIIEVIEGLKEGKRIKDNSSRLVGDLVNFSRESLTLADLQEIYRALSTTPNLEASKSDSCKVIAQISAEEIARTIPNSEITNLSTQEDIFQFDLSLKEKSIFDITNIFSFLSDQDETKTSVSSSLGALSMSPEGDAIFTFEKSGENTYKIRLHYNFEKEDEFGLPTSINPLGTDHEDDSILGNLWEEKKDPTTSPETGVAANPLLGNDQENIVRK